MAYRKTDKIIANMEARRASIIAASIDVIAKHGIEGFTTDAIAERAGIAAGLMYKYFPDKTELKAQAIAQLLRRDQEAIRAAGEGKKPLDALAAGLAVFYGTLRRPHLVHTLAHDSNYHSGIRREFAALIAPVYPFPGRGVDIMAAGAVLGALYGVFDVKGGAREDRAPEAILFALRGIGISDNAARRVVDRAMEEA